MERTMLKNELDPQYLCRLQEVLEDGYESDDRTGTGVKYILGLAPIKINMEDGFPCLTSRRVAFKNQLRELLWMLSGSTNVKDLHPYTLKWWAPFASEDGSLGRTYGEQFRAVRRINDLNEVSPFDQLSALYINIESSPNSRRLCISNWDLFDSHYCNLPPCHGSMIQFAVRGDYLDLTTYNRSQDLILGTPHNIILYSLLLHIFANGLGYRPGKYIHQFGHAHIYKDHLEEAYRLTNAPYHNLPTLEMEVKEGFSNYNEHNFKLVGYTPEGTKYNFKMSV